MQINRAFVGVIPNSLLRLPYVRPSALDFLIEMTLSMVSFFALFGFEVACNTPRLAPWSKLSFWVIHSKLSNRLFAGFRSLWLTVGRSLSGRKLFATNWCTNTCPAIPCSHRLTYKCPERCVLCLSNFPCKKRVSPSLATTCLSRLRTRPKLLTSYSPSHPFTEAHVSSTAKSPHFFLKYASMALRMCSATERSVTLDRALSFSINGAGRNICVRIMPTLYSTSWRM